MSEYQYSGVDNLEAMEEAVNYQRFLAGLIDELGSSAGPAATIVDFGAGVGTYARHAHALGYTVLCVEADERLRSHLADQGFETARSLETVPDQSQRAVYSFNVLEHIEDDDRVLGEIHRVLEPNGRLLLYVPAFPILFSSMDRKVGHLRRYRHDSFVEQARNNRFQVEHCYYADSLGFAASLAYRMFGSRASGDLNPSTVRLYDQWLFPLSRRLDRQMQRWAGKNLVLMARRPGSGSTGQHVEER